MKNYLLTILFVLFGEKITAGWDVSPSYDIVKISLQIEEEKGEKKMRQIDLDDQEKKLHANACSPSIIPDPQLTYSPILNNGKESGFLDHPFTPPDLI